MSLPNLFKLFLISQNFSSTTVKNYVADINHFLSWIQTTKINGQPANDASILAQISTRTIEEYKKALAAKSIPSSTINRNLASLRKFGEFAQAQSLLNTNPIGDIANVNKVFSAEEIVTKFYQHLKKEKVSDLTIKNYLSDIRHFLTWLEIKP